MAGVGAQDRMRRGGELGIFSMEKMRQRQCLIAACSCLMGEGKKGGVRLLLEVPRGWMTSNEHKLEQEKNPICYKEVIFTQREFKCWAWSSETLWDLHPWRHSNPGWRRLSNLI